jgi:hypothetical protein
MVQVYRSFGPGELPQNEPSCFVFSEHLPSVSEEVARVCLLVRKRSQRSDPGARVWKIA